MRLKHNTVGTGTEEGIAKPMNHTRRQFLRSIGTAALAGGGIARTAGAQATPGTPTSPVVRMGNNYFDPVGLQVEPGTTVRFEIAAGTHSATAYEDRIPDGAGAFDSGILRSGSYEHTFETPGTFDYYCIPHETVGMVGRIVVGEPGGPAEESPIPYGDVPESETIVERGAVAYGAAGGASSDGRRGGGMMGGGMGSGMGSGRGMGWSGGLPFVGGALGVLGVAGGALYLALRRVGGRRPGDDPALSALRRRYARGEIDEAEFEERRERLQRGRADEER